MEECLCEYLCRLRPLVTVEKDLLYTYLHLKALAEGAELVQHHLWSCIHHGTSDLRFDEDTNKKNKVLGPRLQKMIRTYLEALGKLTPALLSCDRLGQMNLGLRPEIVLGKKSTSIPRRPPSSRLRRWSDREKNVSTPASSWSRWMETPPNITVQYRTH